MRHVTDGEIHAFLDGGLDSLPTDRGEEIRSHLATCGACQERLQDEELLRARATEILGDPPVGRAELPTFEEIRQRAEDRAVGNHPSDMESESASRYRGPLRGLPLAWAATIVLALGVGWMGGQVWRALPSESPGSPYEPIELTSLQSADLSGDQPDSGRTVPAGTDLTQGPSSPGSGRPGEVEGARREDARSVSSSAPERAEAPPTVSQLRRVTGAEKENPGASASGVPDTVGAVSSAPTANLPESRQAAESSVGEGGGQEVRKSLGAVEGVGAMAGNLENSLAIPGLKVVGIEWEERVQGEKALLIRQLLSPGDTVELRYLGLLLGSETEAGSGRRPGVAGEDLPGARLYANILEASLPPGWNQVVMERERGLLVARGPVSDRNLKALLKTLH